MLRDVQKQIIALRRRILFVVAAFISLNTFAQTGPTNLNVSGALFLPSGLPVTNSSVNFRLEILDKNSTCLLYSEQHLGENLSASKGQFSLAIGRGTSPDNMLEASTVFTTKLFENNGVIAGGWPGCPAGANLASGDERTVRVYYDLGGGFVAMSPDVPIASSAYALIADTLQGKRPTDFVQLRDDMTYDLNQGNVENVFSSTNYARLQQLLNPSAAIGFAGQRLTNLADPSSAQDATTKAYTDTRLGGQTIDLVDVAPGAGGGKVLTWDSSANKWVAMAQSIAGTAGGDLSGSYPNPVVANLAIGTSKLADNAVTSAKISSTGIAPNQLVITDNVAGATLKYATCANNEILKYVMGTGWQCASAASLSAVLSVNGKTGVVVLNGADLGLGTASMRDVGVAATNVPELDGGGKLAAGVIPNFAGDITGAFTSAFVAGLQGRAVASTAPNAGEVLRWNGTLTRWEPSIVVDNVGITALTGDISASGTGSVPATLTNGVVTTPKMFATPGANRLVATDSTTGATLVPFVCNLNESLQWTASGWACANPSTAFLGNNVIVDGGNARGAAISIGTTDNYAVNFKTNNTNKMTILANGNVGIGTTTPSSNLDVVGSANVSGTLNALSVTSSTTVTAGTNVTAPNIFATSAMGVGTSTPARLLEVAGVMRLAPSTLPGTPGAGDVAIDSAAANTLKYHNGSTWVTLGTGNTASSGAANYISKFNGSNSLVNSGLYETGGNVGVGTTSPSRLLSVNGSINVAPSALPGTPAAGDIAIDSGAANSLKYHNGTSWISLAVGGTGDFKADGSVPMSGQFRSIAGTASAPGMTFVGDTDNGIFAPTADNFAISTSGSEKFRILANGNVGLGTSAPASTLDVAGNAAVSNGIEIDKPSALTNQTNGASYTISVSNSASSGSNNWAGVGFKRNPSSTPLAAVQAQVVDRTNNYGDLHFSTADIGGISTRMVVKSGGFVGIGTTSPGRLLSVNGSMNVAPSALPGTPAAGDIAIDSGAANSLKYHNGTSWISLAVGGTGDFLANGSIPMSGQFRSVAGTASAPGMTFVGDTDNGIFAPASDNLAIGTSGSEKLRVLANGNVGIGTTAPASLLSIERNVNAQTSLSVTNNSNTGLANAELALNSTGGNLQIQSTSSASGGGSKIFTNANFLSIGTNNAPGYLAFQSGASAERMRIDNAGNIGIGTTTPNRLLEVAGPIRVSPTVLPGTPAAGDLAIDSGAGNSLKYHNGTSWISLAVGGTGDFKADGSVPMTGQFRSIAGTQTAPGFTFVGDTDNGIFAPASDNFAITTSGSEKVRVLASGSVGIGTTAPLSNLQVVKSSGGTITNPYSASSSFIVQNDAGAGDWTYQQLIGGATGGAQLLMGTRASLNGGIVYNNTVDNLTLRAGGIDRLSMSASGVTTLSNVGIGITTPNRLLEVAGPIRVSPAALPGSPVAGDIAIDSAAANSLKYHNGTSWISLAVGGTGDFRADGTVPMTGQFRSIAGTQTAPGMTFVGDTDTGIFSPSADTIAIGTSGSERLRVAANGYVGIGNTNPGVPLDVAGTLNQTAAGFYKGASLVFDVAPGSTSSANAYYASLNRITTNSSNVVNSLYGTESSAYLYNGSTNVPYMAGVRGLSSNLAGRSVSQAVGGEFSAETGTSGGAVITEAIGVKALVTLGTGTITRAYGVYTGTIQGTSKWSMYASDSTAPSYFAGSIGIGTTSPNRLLEVAGPIRVSPATLPGTPSAGDLAIDSGAGNSLKYHNGTNWVSLAVGGTGDFMSDGSVAMTGQLRHLAGTAAAPGLTFTGDTDTGIFAPAADMVAIGTSGTERIRFSSNGYVGIGTSTPFAKVDIVESFNGNGAVRMNVGDPGNFNPATPAYTMQALNSFGAGYTSIGMHSGSGPTAGRNVIVATRPSNSNGALTFYNDVAGVLTPALTTTSGFVGIGTTAPVQALDVVGNGRVSGTLNIGSTGTAGRLYLNRSSDGGNNASISNFDAEMQIQNSANNSYISFVTNNSGTNSEKMRVTGNGNVGIGTTVPGRLLSVNGSINVAPSSLPGTPAAGDIAIDSAASNSLKYHNGTNWVSLAVGGTGDFMANGSVAMTGQFRSIAGNASAPGLTFVGDTDNGIFAPVADNVAITTSGTEKMRVLANGNVGFGTTNPTDKLQITNATGTTFVTANSTSSSASGFMATSTSGSNTYNGFYSGGAVTGARQKYLGNFGGFFAIGRSDDAWSINDHQFVILNNGNTGIGTSTPSRTLQVAGAMKLNPITNPGSPTAGDIFVDSGATNTLKYHNGTSWVSVGSGSGDIMANGSVPMTGPFRSIAGTVSAPGMTFAGDTSNGIFAPAANNLAITTSGSEALRVLSNGNVGIGTTAPGAKLVVYDTNTNTGIYPLIVAANSGGGPGKYVSLAIDNETGGAYKQGIEFRNNGAKKFSLNVDYNGSGTNNFTVYDNVAALNRMLIDPAGNVGIGLTAPTRLFHVAGAMKLDPSANPGTPTAGDIFVDSGAANALKYHNGTSWVSIGSGTGDFMANGSVAMTGQFRSIAGTQAAPGLSFVGDTDNGIFAPTADNLAIGTSGSEKLRVLANGNVGIGTSAPATTLDVNGIISSSGGSYGNPSYTFRGDTDTGLWNGSGNELDFFTNGSTKLIIGSADTTFDTNNLFIKHGWNGVYTSTSTGVNLPSIAGTYFQSTAWVDGSGMMNLFESKNAAGASQRAYMATVSNASGLTPTFVFGQQTGATAYNERLRIDTNGNLGVGVTTPSRLLHVAGAMKITPTANPGTPTAGDIFVDSTASNALKYHNGSAWVSIGSGTGDFMANGSVPMTGQFRSILGSNTAPGMSFVGDTNTGVYSPGADNIALSTNGAERLRIDATGNIGIGTTNSNAQLKIVSGASTTNLFDVRGQGNSQIFNITWDSPGSGYYQINSIAENFFLGNATESPGGASDWPSIKFGVVPETSVGVGMLLMGNASQTGDLLQVRSNNVGSGGDLFVVKATGNVGIGITTPTRRLQVAGAMKLNPVTNPGSPTAGDIFVDSTASNALKYHNGSAWVSIGSGSGDFMANGSVPMTGQFRSILGTATAPGLTFTGDTDNGIFAPAADNFAITTSGTEKLRVLANGNVGIGTTAPSSKFSVGGAATDNANFFYDNANVANGVDGQSLYIYRRSAGGDSSIRLYNDQFRQAHLGVTGNGNLFIEAQQTYMYANAYGPYTPTDTTRYFPDQGGPVLGNSNGNDNFAGGVVFSSNNGLGNGQHAYLQAVSNAAGYTPTIVIGAQTGSTSYAERLRIDTNGNLGIGTTAPSRLLQVAGAMKITPTGNPNSPTAGDIYVDSTAANALKYHNGTSWVSIGSGSGDFMANGSVPMTAPLRAFAGTVAQPGMTFVGDTGNGISAPAGNTLAISTSGVERMRVLSSGNLGIGTTNPLGALEVIGASSSYIRSPSGAISYPLTIANNVGTAGNDRGAAINFRLNNNELGAVGAAQQSTNNGYLTLMTATSSTLTEKMRIDSAGNVGIGTTSPARLLSVNGPINVAPTTLPGSPAPGDIAIDSAAANALKYHNGSAWVTVGAGGSGLPAANGSASSPTINFANSTGTGFFRAGVSMLGVATAGNEVMRIDASGYVGIGVTAPLAMLDVAGSLGLRDNVNGLSNTIRPNINVNGAARTLRFENSTGTTTEGFQFYNSNLNTSLMMIQQNGKVGIGTSAPQALLSVYGNGQDANIWAQRSTNTVAANVNYVTSGTKSNSNVDWSTGMAGIAGDYASYQISSYNGSTDTVRMEISAAGNMAIGSSSPVAKVTISRPSSPTSVSVANEYLHMGGNYQAANGLHLIGFGYVTSETMPNAYMGFQEKSVAGSGYGDLVFGTRNVTTDTAPTERMRIDNAGNVGIGTTGPGSTLTVNGSFAITPSAVAASADNQLIAVTGISYLSVASNNGTATNRTICLDPGTLGQRLIIANANNNDFEMGEGAQPCSGSPATIDNTSGTVSWGTQDDIHEYVFTVNNVWKQLY